MVVSTVVVTGAVVVAAVVVVFAAVVVFGAAVVAGAAVVEGAAVVVVVAAEAGTSAAFVAAPHDESRETAAIMPAATVVRITLVFIFLLLDFCNIFYIFVRESALMYVYIWPASS